MVADPALPCVQQRHVASRAPAPRTKQADAQTAPSSDKDRLPSASRPARTATLAARRRAGALGARARAAPRCGFGGCGIYAKVFELQRRPREPTRVGGVLQRPCSASKRATPAACSPARHCRNACALAAVHCGGAPQPPSCSWACSAQPMAAARAAVNTLAVLDLDLLFLSSLSPFLFSLWPLMPPPRHHYQSGLCTASGLPRSVCSSRRALRLAGSAAALLCSRSGGAVQHRLVGRTRARRLCQVAPLARFCWCFGARCDALGCRTRARGAHASHWGQPEVSTSAFPSHLRAQQGNSRPVRTASRLSHGRPSIRATTRCARGRSGRERAGRRPAARVPQKVPWCHACLLRHACWLRLAVQSPPARAARTMDLRALAAPRHCCCCWRAR